MSDNNYSRQSRKQKKNHQKKPKRKVAHTSALNLWLKRGLLVVFAAIMLVLISGGGLFLYHAQGAPELTDDDLYGAYYSSLVDKDGHEFYRLGTDSREFASAEEYPELLTDAVKSIEDQRFDSHNGFDFIGIGRAAVDYLRAGEIVSGGSTITQQLVKLSVFSTLREDQTIERKSQEIWLSMQLERRLSKEQIMTLYLNKVHMAGNVYGMGTAAKEYYGKHVSELELHEAALFAGMPQSPNSYNPYTEPERAKQRRDEVLAAMYNNDKITKEQMEQAQAIPIEQGLQEKIEQTDEDTLLFDSYLSAVLDEVYEKTDFDPYKAGLEIHTNYDSSVQQILHDVAHSEDYISIDSDIQTAISVVNPNNGEILGILGGRNLQGQLSYNRATKNRRNVGSTIKPITSYGPAIEYNQYSTHEQIVDEPYSPAGSNWNFNNYDNQYLGQMSMREALVQSRNIPAAKIMNDYMNIENVETFVSKLGLDPKEISGANGLVPSNSIDGSMTPLQLAGAYSAFANEGIYTEPHTVNKVVTQRGQEIDMTPESTRAMEDYTAYMMTDMLKGVPEARPEINVPGIYHAGKTGTTNFTDEQFEEYNLPRGMGLIPDSWYVGYTQDFVISTWVGYDEPFKEGNQLIFGDTTHNLPLYYYSAIMNQLAQTTENTDWIKPDSVSEVNVVSGSSPAQLPNRSTPFSSITTELFVAGTEPQSVAPAPVQPQPTEPQVTDEDEKDKENSEEDNNDNNEQNPTDPIDEEGSGQQPGTQPNDPNDQNSQGAQEPQTSGSGGAGGNR